MGTIFAMCLRMPSDSAKHWKNYPHPEKAFSYCKTKRYINGTKFLSKCWSNVNQFWNAFLVPSILPKNERKFNFTAIVPQVKLFSFFFVRSRSLINHFTPLCMKSRGADQSASWRYLMRIITVSLYCQALKTLNWILKPDHNLPIEPLFVSDMEGFYYNLW